MTRFLAGFLLATFVATAGAALSRWPFPTIVEAPGMLFIPVAAAIDTCAAGTKGLVYYDTTGANLCVCNGTNFVDVKDASTTCS